MEDIHGSPNDDQSDDDLADDVERDAAAQASVDDVTASNSSGGKKKHYFLKELRCMMYGFGDDKVPYTETVELVEQLVIEFITAFTCRAMEVGKPGRVQMEDIWYLIRNDPRKFQRVRDLLSMNEELRKARKAFDEAKFGGIEQQKEEKQK